MTRQRTGLVALLAISLSLTAFPRLVSGQPQTQSLDAVLAAYVGGDFTIVDRTFTRSIEVQKLLRLDKPRELDRWLGPWHRGKALLLLEFARASARVAPQFVRTLVEIGRRYVAAAPPEPGDGGSFLRIWHRAAAALLHGATDPERVEEHVADLDRANGGAGRIDSRLLLARATAQESRCWQRRPTLDRPTVRVQGLLSSADARVQDDPDAPTKAQAEDLQRKHSACLKEAQLRFEAATTGEEADADEARVRGAWVLIQDGRASEAISWLDAANPRDDRDLQYWHALFRGRALSALGRHQEAVAAYRAALGLYPRAQSAGTGLVLALLHLDRFAEADEVARSVREGGAMTPDAWIHYPFGDQRFAGMWIESLRTILR
jgi:tetratricopeptide (TPR) repeat protein